MAKKITTIEDLAVMINQSFTETQKHIDTRLAALKGELTGIMKDMAEELTTDVSADRVHSPFVGEDSYISRPERRRSVCR